MARNKQLKLAEVEGLPNVFPYEKSAVEEEIAEFFGNKKPLVLEIGCGDADYSRNLITEYPERNYIGIDVRGARIWNAAKKADAEKISNLALIIARAEFITEMFKSFKFEEIWIPFPDPFPRKRNEGRRLICPSFIDRYSKITVPGAVINLKTDDEGLYQYGLEICGKSNVEILFQSPDLYSENNLDFKQQIKTKYEMQHLKEGKTIKLISFRFK